MSPWCIHLHHFFVVVVVFVFYLDLFVWSGWLSSSVICSWQFIFSQKIICLEQNCKIAVFRCELYVNIQGLMLTLSVIPSFSQQNHNKSLTIIIIMIFAYCIYWLRHMCDEIRLCGFPRMWCILTFPTTNIWKNKVVPVWEKDLKTYLILFGWTNTKFSQEHVPNTSQPCIPSLPHLPSHLSSLMA